MKARENAQLNSIFNNLRILEGAKDQWALENKKGTGDAVAAVSTVSDYLKGGTIKTVVLSEILATGAKLLIGS